jgi:hypothetical protein
VGVVSALFVQLVKNFHQYRQAADLNESVDEADVEAGVEILVLVRQLLQELDGAKGNVC